MSTEQHPDPTPPRAQGRIDQVVAELAEGALGLAKLLALSTGGKVYQRDERTVCIDYPLETIVVRITRE